MLVVIWALICARCAASDSVAEIRPARMAAASSVVLANTLSIALAPACAGKLPLPAQDIAFEHTLQPQPGKDMDHLAAMVHVVGDDVGDGPP